MFDWRRCSDGKKFSSALANRSDLRTLLNKPEPDVKEREDAEDGKSENCIDVIK